MWHKKKFIIGIVLATVLLAAGIGGGVALAADGENETENTATVVSLWDKMAEALQNNGIDVTSEQLQDAYATAQQGIRDEALKNFLDKQVENGVITQEQADAYQNWLESMPDMGANFRAGPGGLFGYKIENRGDNLPGMFGGMQDFGHFRGFGGMRGEGGPCIPSTPTPSPEATN